MLDTARKSIRRAAQAGGAISAAVQAQKAHPALPSAGPSLHLHPPASPAALGESSERPSSPLWAPGLRLPAAHTPSAHTLPLQVLSAKFLFLRVNSEPSHGSSSGHRFV